MKRVLIVSLLFTTTLSAQPVDSLSYVLGKFDYEQSALFVKVPEAVASHGGMYLRKEALKAFLEMQQAARATGIELKIVSATRNFDHQKRIWEAKWNGQRKVDGQNLKASVPDEAARARIILKYSSMPGTSRHHWGTDIDINSVNPSYFASDQGEREYQWLREHAAEFGFCQPYTQKNNLRPFGYEEEKWHWTYTPVASELLRYYDRNVKAQHIYGFSGSDALSFSEVKTYVVGIAEECK